MKRGRWIATLATLLLLAHTAVLGMDTKEAADQLATQVAQAMPDGRGIKIAVTDFTDGRGVTSD